MIPAILMGVVTNVFLTLLFIYIDAFIVILSPLISLILFLIYFFLLKSDKLTSKLVFLIVSYTVVIEIFIHSYCLGWDMGFYYYMFLLPIIFLLNSTWKMWMIVFFNSSIVVLSILLCYLVYGEVSIFPVPKALKSLVGLVNLLASGGIIFVIMLYFSRTINKKDEALVNANIELVNQNKKIIGQHDNLEVLLKEVHHRVKNNLQIISSLMSLERNTIENNEVIEILNESKRRVESIALIHQNLYLDTNFNRVDFNSYLEEILNSQQIMSPDLDCLLDSPKIVLDLDTAVPLGLIVSEMITNAIKHAYDNVDNPELKVLLLKSGNDFELLFSDNGCGLSEDFNLDNPESLGLEIITALTAQIDGEIECFNNENGGASFKILLKNKLIEY